MFIFQSYNIKVKVYFHNNHWIKYSYFQCINLFFGLLIIFCEKEHFLSTWPCLHHECYWTNHMNCTIYMVQLIATQLQHCQNNSFSINMQLHIYNHDVMLTFLIYTHPLKFDTWHYEDFWILKLFSFWNINLHHLLWLLMMFQDYDTWHNKKIATWHINWIYKKLNKYLF
jgi:hypothetical protein